MHLTEDNFFSAASCSLTKTGLFLAILLLLAVKNSPSYSSFFPFEKRAFGGVAYDVPLCDLLWSQEAASEAQLLYGIRLLVFTCYLRTQWWLMQPPKGGTWSFYCVFCHLCLISCVFSDWPTAVRFTPLTYIILLNQLDAHKPSLYQNHWMQTLL